MKTLSVYRTENKYIINSIQMQNIKAKLDKILKRDFHSQNGSYMVRSLYFDSINNIDFQTKLAGTEIRKKIRIRTYDTHANKCKLEMKAKNGDNQHKISLWITKDDTYQLINRKFDVLKKYFNTNEAAIDIYLTMRLGCYIPVVMVEYERIAYTYPINNARITFDFNIKSSESNFDLFDSNILYNNIMLENIVLEVKYNGKSISFINNILNKFKIVKTSISKYCLSRYIFYDFNF